MVCLTTHLQRVHKFEKGSDAYKEAIENKRRYLGRRKEVRRVERGIKMTKPKKRSAKKDPPAEGTSQDAPEDEQPSPRKHPVQILVEEAELSDGSDPDFGDIIPPTPPPVTEEESPVTLLITEQPAQEPSDEDSDEDYEAEEDEDDDEVEDDEFITLKEYYARGTARQTEKSFTLCFVTTLKTSSEVAKKSGRPFSIRSTCAEFTTIWTPKRKTPALNRSCKMVGSKSGKSGPSQF